MEEMKNNVAETWFAWSGPTDQAGLAYFRIQGPTVIIEYAPPRQGRKRDDAHPHDLSRPDQRLWREMVEVIRGFLPWLFLALGAWPSAARSVG